jgi:hypothetical protein
MKQARRDFLMVASMTAVGVQTLRPVAASLPGAPRLTVIFDKHLADSRAFALRACMAGAQGVALSGDIGEMWFELLKPDDGSRQNAFAGLTHHADAFLLARLAQGAGMRVTQRPAGALIMWRLDPGIG